MNIFRKLLAQIIVTLKCFSLLLILLNMYACRINFLPEKDYKESISPDGKFKFKISYKRYNFPDGFYVYGTLLKRNGTEIKKRRIGDQDNFDEIPFYYKTIKWDISNREVIVGPKLDYSGNINNGKPIKFTLPAN